MANAQTEAPDITVSSWVMVMVLGLVWGSSFLFVELAIEGITPFWLAATRILLASVVTTIVWQMRGGVLFKSAVPPPWALLTIVGALSTALPFMLLSWGQQYVTAGFAGVSMAAVALMVLPLAHFLIPGEQMSVRKTLGFVVGFAGVVVLIGPEALRASGIAGEIPGRLACLAAAACYAVSSVLMRRIPPIDGFGLSAVTLWIGAVVVTISALWKEGIPAWPVASIVVVIIVLGLVQTAMANMLRIVVVRTAGPTFMSLTNYMVPIWSVVLGVVFLGEPLEPTLFTAMVLIFVGVALSQWNALRQLFR